MSPSSLSAAFLLPFRRVSAWAPWATLAAMTSGAVALCALAGWAFDAPRLRSILPGAVEMKANTAVALLLCSTALLIASPTNSRALRRAVQALASAAALIGATSLVEYGAGVNLGIDELLVRDTATAYNVYRGRMSPYTASAFVCLGIAIFVLALRRFRPVKWVSASAVITIGAVSTVGYLWNARELVTDRLVPPVAINTALVLMLLGVATLQAGRRAWEIRAGLPATRLLSMEGKVIASLLGALLLLFLGGGYTYRATVQFEDSMNAFAAHQEVRAALARIVALAGDVDMLHESYMRGGREARRELYVQRVREMSVPLDTLGALLENDAARVGDVTAIRHALSDWFTRMDDDIRLRARSGVPVPLPGVGVGDPGHVRVLELVDALDATEAREQAEQRVAATHLREFTLASLLLTLAVASALCVLLFRALQRASQMRGESRRLDALSRDVFGLLATTLDRMRALNGTVGKVALLRTNGGCAFYSRGTDDTLVREAIAGAADHLAPRLRLGQGRIGEVAATRRSSQTPEDPLTLTGHAAANAHRSMFACPVVYLGRTAGVLVVVSARSLRGHETAFVERVADALGAALGNLRTHADLQALSGQLAATNEALKRQAAELDQANRMKSEFLATMSHELRTPLNAIIGFAEVLKDDLVGELTEQQREYVGDILDSGEHLLQLINDILDLSKVEAGKMDLDPDVVELRPLFENSLAMVKEKALAHRIELFAHVDESLGCAWFDARKLKQIVYNLLSNAVKFTPDGGTVTLRVEGATHDDAPWLEVTVTDTGIGISPEDQARLFQPFVQIDGSLGKQFQGTGLGLAMVKRLSELQGGYVRLESTPGRGSSFTVVLPCRVAADGESGTPSEWTAAVAEPRGALVIEPDLAVADRTRADLEGLGLRAVHAIDLDAAWALAAVERPDVVVLSASMTAETSNTVVARLSGDERLAGVPVVLQSADTVISAGASSSGEPKLRAALTALKLLPEPGRPLTALVVDDEPRVAELLDAYLQSAGLRVIRVTNGADALAEACAEQPDVIVLDLIMPNMSGFDVIDMIKAIPTTRSIPIVVCTAKSLTQQDRSALKGQVRTVLSKTEFSRSDFVREVMWAAAGGEKG